MFNMNFKSTVPIYEQIIAQAKEFVLKGFLKPGEPMPSIRKLAAMLDVNPNTVAKAYQELERQHIIVTIRGKGAFVEENPCIEKPAKELAEGIKKGVAQMLLSGMSEEEILTCVKSVIADLGKKGE